jgi:homoserine O-acetyltransferase
MRVERDTVSLGAFEFAAGDELPLECAYEAYGDPGDPTVLLCHALTGSQHVTDAAGAHGPGGGDAAATSGQARAWWSDVVGPGKAIDTDAHHVVCVNVPGSCYGTTGPASEGPDGKPYGPDFPAVTVGDWTRAQRRTLDALGVDRLHAVVGGSVGGMNVLEWVKRYPDDVDRAVPVATAPRLDAQCVALSAVARRAITSDPDWQGGDYYGGPEPDRGLALARQLGHVTYLSKDSMDRKFGREASRGVPGEGPFPADPTADAFPYREVASYLDHQADRFVDRFDANSYLYLTRAMEGYDVAAGHGSDAEALAGFDGELLVVSFTGDWHFTVEQGESLVAAAGAAGVDAVHHVVDSDHGHDAFLVEPESVGPPLSSFLSDGVAGVARDGSDPHAPVHASLIGD